MDGLYARLCEYDTLEAAYETVYLDLTDPPENDEAWLMNLHNHLVWRSYEPGADADMDTVVLAAISRVLEAHGLRAGEVAEPELRRIILDLTEV